MKKILILIVLCLLAVPCHARYQGPQVTQVTEATGDAVDINVDSTNTRRSKSFRLDSLEAFSVMYRCTSDGTVNVQLDMEQSYLQEDRGESVPWYVIPENKVALDTITNENWHILAYSPVATKYARFKMTGLSGNDASTTIEFKVNKMENI